MHTRGGGFTIVELLIVIVVIAILAAVTVVAYNGVQNRTHDAAIQADLNVMAKKMELYFADNSQFPSTQAALDSLGFKVTQTAYAIDPAVTRNAIYCSQTTPTVYAYLAKSKSGNAYYVSEAYKTPRPLAATWNNATTAGSLCSGLGYSSTLQAAGYWNAQTPNWLSWTGGN